MKSTTRDLIEYYGISAYPKFIECFNQTNVDSIITIPIQKPDIDQVIKVWVDYKLLNKQIIKTPKGTSLEGQNLTGNTLFISGDLIIKIEYIACESVQGIYTTESKVPFATSVVLPDGFSSHSLVNADIIIEDILCDHLDQRSIYTNTTMMAVANTC